VGPLLAVALAIGAVSPAVADTTSQQASVLFAVNGEHARLHQVDGRTYRLRLRGADARTVWFTDRPARQSGTLRTSLLARHWSAYGFGSDAPNVALVLHSPVAGTQTLVAVMRHPRYSRKVLTARLRVLTQEQAGDVNGPLADHASRHGHIIPKRLGNVTLFVDNAAGTVINGCLIGPGTVCWKADLSGADLSGADLHQASIEGSDLRGTRLDGANLRNASLVDSDLTGATARTVELSFADLTGVDATRTDFGGSMLGSTRLNDAKLVSSNLTGTTLSNAWLIDADLTNANLTGAYMYAADLLRATVTGANFSGATMTNVRMPDGNYCDTASWDYCKHY